MFKWCNKKTKKLGCWDIALTKWAVFAVTLGLVSGWKWFQTWVIGISWYWFIGIGLILAIIPMKNFFRK